MKVGVKESFNGKLVRGRLKGPDMCKEWEMKNWQRELMKGKGRRGRPRM